jgi:hypothetical protein
MKRMLRGPSRAKSLARRNLPRARFRATRANPVLIVAHPEDRLAARVYAALRRRYGSAAALIVSDAELVFAPGVVYHLESDRARSMLRLADGFQIDSERIGVVFNRLHTVDPRHFDGFREVDRLYAIMETHALWLAWLAALPCPVLNPASARGLCGPILSNTEWMRLTANAGLAARGWWLSTDRRRMPANAPAQTAHERDLVVAAAITRREPQLGLEALVGEPRVTTVIANEVLGAFRQEYRSELIALARSVCCVLIEVKWYMRAGGTPHNPRDWRVSHVSGMLDWTDDAIVAALCGALLKCAETGANP